MTDNPKLFISYSWTSEAHQEWVLTFAQELSSHGIHVIFDKWDLKPGHDANAYMESMVTDTSVNKVLLICDAEYARKSDLRTGGAGTEAQIITPQLYARREQDKFAAVVREKNPDGSHCLPTYYQGRIFFDLSDDDKYALEFEKLIRWAWDKPAYLRPELGPKPTFLTDDASAVKLGTSLAFRRAQEAIKAGRDQAEAILSEYLEKFASEIEKFRITENNSATPLFDEIVVNNISEFTPYRNEFIELVISIAMYRPRIDCAISIHRFFEKIEPYCRRPSKLTSWRQNDFDNFKFIVQELFLYTIAAFIKFERFSLAAHLINTEYFTTEERNRPMRPFTIFRENLGSIEVRSTRLQRTSCHSDILKERCQSVGVDFRHLMVADFVLYIRSCDGELGFAWWPETLLYARSISAFEIFARAKSKDYFSKIAPMLGVKSAVELQEKIKNLERRSIPHWQFDTLDIAKLANISNLSQTP